MAAMTETNNVSRLKRFKVLVCGSRRCGITSFIHRVVTNSFEEHIPIRDTYTMMSEVDGTEVGLVIVDGTRESSLRSTTSSFYRGASLVLVCYDITSLPSFSSVKGELADAERYTDARKVLIGCKSDLHSNRQVQSHMVVWLSVSFLFFSFLSFFLNLSYNTNDSQYNI
eukprot:TRINITY_DN953_c0_g2_i2.p1 TRINITY_DN953_c0_g2~~TRINITY_DN953_c0_g2_i2.p1  ORF type:complete len:169 (-),score=13.58 TRINITY_DN953_c0_g2_i2:30-536(-)